MKITRRLLASGAVASPLAAMLTKLASAQSWPSGIVKIIVPFPPGGRWRFGARW